MSYQIQAITATQDAKICQIIKLVGAECGAIGEGYGPSDPEVEAISKYYKDCENSLYLVATINGEVVGGCGITRFANRSDVCELRKLFLLPKSRGIGLGEELTERCLSYAKNNGYLQCYLDTLFNMQSAIALYEKMGFSHLVKPLLGTEHSACDVWMLKEL
jgi:putative acetyltransferase